MDAPGCVARGRSLARLDLGADAPERSLGRLTAPPPQDGRDVLGLGDRLGHDGGALGREQSPRRVDGHEPP